MGMKRIEVDNEVFEKLQSLAEPLVDDANSVLRRVLGVFGSELDATATSRPPIKPSSGAAGAMAVESRPSARHDQDSANRQETRLEKIGRARRGSLLPQAAYEKPVLESLIEFGGSAPSSVVIDRVGEKLEAQFTDIDRDKTSGTSVIRWRNRTQFARHALVEKGQMRRDSPHGVWEISQAGRDRVKNEATNMTSTT